MLVTLARHDEAANRRFEEEVGTLDHIISADWVTGEIDAMLMIVARDVAELQRVLSRLSTRGGAQRLITLLRLEELKPARRCRSPLDKSICTGTVTGTMSRAPQTASPSRPSPTPSACRA